METTPRADKAVKPPDDKSSTGDSASVPAQASTGANPDAAPPARKPWPLKWILLAVVAYALIYNLCLLIWN